MYIVADVGGTKTRVAGSPDLETLDTPIIVDTPSTYEGIISTIAQTVSEASRGEKIRDIVLGKPQWKQYPAFAKDLEVKTGMPVRIENDAALVGLGEAVFGAGKGGGIVVYITVSTGVNGVRIVDGTIDRSVHGFEIGSQYLSMEPKLTFEQLVSGTAVAAKYGVAPRDLDKNSPVWEELARITAFGVYNSITHWSPDRVVLGGSMFNEIGISADRVSFHVSDINTKYAALPSIVHSDLKDVGGLYGGLALLRQCHEGEPRLK